VPVLPVCLFEPLRVQFSALLPERPRFAPSHPLGCHRERVADRVVFEHVIAAPVRGSGYERIASPGCSEGTIRRRPREWAAAGLSEQVHTLALRAYDRMIGLELDDLVVDGCVTKAPSGGEAAGRSPVDRGKGSLKRSVVTEGTGLPLHLVSAGANRHDAPLLEPTLAGLDKLDRLPDEPTVHLDRGYDGRPARALLEVLGFDGAIARKGVPAPVQAGARWVVEIIQSQLTKPRVEAAPDGRNRVADLDVVIGDHHAIDQELDQFAALLEGGGLQVLAESGADLRHGRQDLGRVQQPLREELPLPRGKLGHAVGEPSLPLLERGQIQQPCHVRVEQPFPLPLQALACGPDAGVLLLDGLELPGSRPCPLQRLGEDLGRLEHRAEVCPDQGVELGGRDEARWAQFLVPERDRRLPSPAEGVVVLALAGRHRPPAGTHEAAQAAVAATDEPPEQVLVLQIAAGHDPITRSVAAPRSGPRWR
jgi:hypothetical protein